MGVMDLFFERQKKPEEVKPPARKTVVQPVTVSSAIQPVYAPQPNLPGNGLGPDYEEFKARFKKILDSLTFGLI